MRNEVRHDLDMILDRFHTIHLGREKWSESRNDFEEQSERNKSEFVKVFL